MGGLSYREQMEWRNRIEDAIREKTDKNMIFIHPPNYYQYNDGVSESEKMIWELNQIRDSDIVIIDISTISDSIGTHVELGIVEGVNQFGNKHIYVIGIGKLDTNHPWINELIFRKEENTEDAAEYICSYLLV